MQLKFRPLKLLTVLTEKFVFTENLEKLDVYWKNVLQRIPEINELTIFVWGFFI